MFVVNVKKCLSLFERVYVSSDDDGILETAREAGAIPIKRPDFLCGDTPNIPVYQHALSQLGGDGIVAVQANSPTVSKSVIRKVIHLMRTNNEVITTHPNGKIYGSVWAISRNKLENYLDFYHPTPDATVKDSSIDIHTFEDYFKALYEKDSL